MKHTTLLRATIVLAVAGSALSLAACSSPSSSSSSSLSSSTGPTAASGLGERWGSCVRDAGFEVSDPTDEAVRSGVVSVPEGVDQDAFTDASKRCAESLGISGTSTAEQQRWAREYDEVADCIREHGFPDLPEQQQGVLDFQSYPRSAEPGFQGTVSECLAEFSPDTKQQGS